MSKPYQKGLFIFSQDLRLHDQAALRQASLFCENLICIFIFNERWFRPTIYGTQSMGSHRKQFLWQSLEQLDQQLRSLGQRLWIYQGNPISITGKLINTAGIDAVFASHQAGLNERRQNKQLQHSFPQCQFHYSETHSLYYRQQTTWGDTFPASFSQFKRDMRSCVIDPPTATIDELPPPFPILVPKLVNRPYSTTTSALFAGGELRGLNQLKSYCRSPSVNHYHESRNQLDGWSNSSKLSPWLANGCLSVKTCYARLCEIGEQSPDNPAIQALKDELLWREFFQWYAMHHGARLFQYQGINRNSPLTSFYPNRFKQWCNGNTPWRLVNACMNQLKATGFLSNRGRQIVASCLVNELDSDWRWGAAYFEEQLLDHDVAVNWGNWQYIAGVGADPRGGRHFNLEKQQQLYDPEQSYQNQWSRPEDCETINHVDAADWPIS